MKKIILGSLLAANFMFGDNVKYLYEDSQLTCPNLSGDLPKCYSCDDNGRKKLIEEHIEIMRSLKEDFKTIRNGELWDIYEKALQNYNNKQNIDEYIDSQVWLGIKRYPIHLSLINLKESINNYSPAEPKENLEKYKNEFNRIISLIKPENPDWCFEIANKDVTKYSEELVKDIEEGRKLHKQAKERSKAKENNKTN